MRHTGRGWGTAKTSQVDYRLFCWLLFVAVKALSILFGYQHLYRVLVYGYEWKLRQLLYQAMIKWVPFLFFNQTVTESNVYRIVGYYKQHRIHLLSEIDQMKELNRMWHKPWIQMCLVASVCCQRRQHFSAFGCRIWCWHHKCITLITFNGNFVLKLWKYIKTSTSSNVCILSVAAS